MSIFNFGLTFQFANLKSLIQKSNFTCAKVKVHGNNPTFDKVLSDLNFYADLQAENDATKPNGNYLKIGTSLRLFFDFLHMKPYLPFYSVNSFQLDSKRCIYPE